MKRYPYPILLLAIAVAFLKDADAASLRLRGVGPELANTCPRGTTNALLDGCQDANPTALYQNVNMDDYFRDDSNNVATLAVRPGHAPGVPFNVAGRDFPVGPIAPFVYKDPADWYFATTGSNVNGTTFTAGTVTQGVVRDGLILWSSPSSAGLLTNQPVLSGCTGGGGSGTVCTINISQSNKTGPYHGSHAAGCSWSNGGASLSQWTCDFRYPNNALTATFDHFEFGAVGSHVGTLLRVSNSDNGEPTLVMTSNHIVVDASTNGQTIIGTTVGVRANLVFTDNECDGGNSAVATGAIPASFPFKLQTGCIGWGGNGTSGDTTSVVFKRNYIHDFAGNPVQIGAGYTDTINQANVFYRPGMNNGNDGAGGQTGLHGATINWNTTAVGSVGSIKRYNDVAIYPYGYRAGVTTAPFAVLGGLGAALTVDYDQQLTTSIMNVSTPGHATSSEWINLLRIGAISNLNLKNNYVSTIGIVHNGCFAAGGDVNPGNITASAAPSVGNDWTLWTVSGIFTGIKEKPLPGQAMTPSAVSSARHFYATFTDLLDGTSQMDVTLGVSGPTNDFATWQVVGLGLADLQTNPTIVQSPIDSNSYVVSDGTGSGRNLSERSLNIAFVIQPYGAHGTTATGGSTPSNYNGTYALHGEFTTASTSTWGALGVGIGNYGSLATDVDNNYDVISGDELTMGGMSLGNGHCPGTNPG